MVAGGADRDPRSASIIQRMIHSRNALGEHPEVARSMQNGQPEGALVVLDARDMTADVAIPIQFATLGAETGSSRSSGAFRRGPRSASPISTAIPANPAQATKAV
jgi:hypothetical protein